MSINPAQIDLISLPMVPIGPGTLHLPNVAGVYFILLDGSVLYVGRAASLAGRWRSKHQKYDQIVQRGLGAQVAWLVVDDEALLPAIEIALIKHFRPPLNVAHNSTGRNQNTASVMSGRIPRWVYDWYEQEATRIGCAMGTLLRVALVEYAEQYSGVLPGFGGMVK